MLYLVYADGTIEELEKALSANVDEETGMLVCFDKDGEIVASYPRLTILAFSHTPFPTEADVERPKQEA